MSKNFLHLPEPFFLLATVFYPWRTRCWKSPRNGNETATERLRNREIPYPIFLVIRPRVESRVARLRARETTRRRERERARRGKAGNERSERKGKEKQFFKCLTFKRVEAMILEGARAVDTELRGNSLAFLSLSLALSPPRGY